MINSYNDLADRTHGAEHHIPQGRSTCVYDSLRLEQPLLGASAERLR
jgi:hypothetical protein